MSAMSAMSFSPSTENSQKGKPRRAQQQHSPKVTAAEITFVRRRSSTADITVTTFGATYNHIKLINETLEGGTTRQRVEYPYDSRKHDFVAHFKEMSAQERKDLMAKSWIEIVLDVTTNYDKSEELFAQLDKLGPDFVNNVVNLDIRVHIPELELIGGYKVNALPSTLAGQFLQKVVAKIRDFEAVKHMNIVLATLHSSPEGYLDIQLVFILPFFLLKFTDWTFKYQTPKMMYPKVATKADLNRLIELNYEAMQEAKAAEWKAPKAKGARK